MTKKKSKNKVASRIGENVKRLLKGKGLSKSDLVRKTQLDYHTIAKIENGNTPDPRINTLMQIAAAVDEPIGKLIE